MTTTTGWELAAPQQLAADPLPMPPVGWGAADAFAALELARPALPMSLPAAQVVSVLTTVVLRAGSYAVKVYPVGTDAAHLGTIATALAGSTTAVLPVHAPVTTAYGVVSVLPWLDVSGPVGWPAIGELLRRFHAEHRGAPVAGWTPLRRVVAQAEGLPCDVAAVLLAARDALLGVLAEMSWVLPPDLIHGDVSPGNVLRTPDGPRLIDLDFVAHGPREYDLASAARRRATGEISRATYRRFCTAYGMDVTSWDGLTVLDRIAQLSGVAFSLWDQRRLGRPVDRLDRVVAEWRTPL